MTKPFAAIEPAAIRRVLGQFATGVTIITTRSPDGRAVGITANSFSSVSLDPPLVLWSLARSSSSYAAFAAARYWAIHILAQEQEALSGRFASRGIDRFAGVPTRNGIGDTPLIEGCVGWLQCERAVQYDGGDHAIFLGEVRSFTQRQDAAPLVFHGGQYRRLASADASALPLRETGGALAV
ncbi:flavin reductase family protein [Paraburkholderia sp. SIMBA_027]|uniref:flavin reductase family protein n=1 Tax=Paraburkholderia sp. SIMBA_027 TaxID=3085770 RepID=UPI00397C5650